MIAVISADLLSSTSYSQELLEKVINSLNQEFKLINKLFPEDSGFKIFRGDSFQGIIYDPGKALKVAIQLKTSINRIHLHEDEVNKAFRKEADLRLAIGIGTYDFKRDSIMEANGQAFQYSGRTLDEMKKENRKIQLKTPVENVNNEFDTSLLLFDTIADKWSTASAEVIYYLLRDLKEADIAAELGISQSAVNQRKKAAGWDAIEKLLTRYEFVTKEHFSNGE
ncbi:SatD family protein [Christiangramia sp. SM2212]|uniref:SatD family protein n=1 Tax=Christiangramia sediminicola TaxID=3073267 RepID=A0ABU1EPT1_9FLAO|nr:SatD family protein [Christiangramia sp. SM2212]MDR5590168.1 SatD family protein [Christiangramia sp. SM2212]